jgi:hypothetical protein
LDTRAKSDDDWLEWNLGRWRAADHLPEDPILRGAIPLDCPESS